MSQNGLAGVRKQHLNGGTADLMRTSLWTRDQLHRYPFLRPD